MINLQINRRNIRARTNQINDLSFTMNSSGNMLSKVKVFSRLRSVECVHLKC